MDDREILLEFAKQIDGIAGDEYIEFKQGADQAISSLHSYLRKQLLEKLGEKKIEVRGSQHDEFYHTVDNPEARGYNQLHDHITSIINEVLSGGEMNRQRPHMRDRDIKLKDGDQDWGTPCSNCGATPTMHPTGLCGPCCTGEAETANGNW